MKEATPEGEKPMARDGQAAVVTQRRGHVLLVTLNRPDARNAVNLVVSLGLGNALEEAEADAAEGPRAFAGKRVPNWQAR